MGTMTARGPAAGGTRYEDEQELDSLVAGQIVSRATHVVVKVRSSVWLGEDGWVIDRFLSGNAPLLLAEVERNGPVVDLGHHVVGSPGTDPVTRRNPGLKRCRRPRTAARARSQRESGSARTVPRSPQCPGR